MRKGYFAKSFLEIYFNREFSLSVLAFNLLTISGMTTGIVVAVLSTVTNAGAANININLGLAATGALLLYVVEKTKTYRIGSWIIIVTVFFIAFPVLFFTAGGYQSGMPSFFAVAIIFSAILLEKYQRIVVNTLEILLYSACCGIAYNRPDLVSSFPSEFDYVCDVIVGISVSGILLLLVVLIYVRFFYNKQLELQELIHELALRSETLERYDRMKSDFLATVAHEINTPLAVIAASSGDTLDLLNESPINSDEIRENQKVISRRIKLIDTIMLDLMDTVAIEHGRLSLSRQDTNLYTLLEEVCKAQFAQLDNAGNVLKFEMQPDLPKVWLDPARLEQVMTNLISNAVLHTRGGVITVKLEQIGRSQIVRVADTGDGMDAETAQVALKQYASTKADYWRHGIGLFVCRRIIVSHGGDIWIDSEKGKGTTISFSLREEPDNA